MTRVEGRTEDFLVLRDGRRLPAHPFYHCIDPVPGVRRWRIIQEQAGLMRLELVTGAGLTSSGMRRIIDDLQALTHGQMEVIVVPVAALAIDPGAKFRTITSRVGQWPRP